jgi:hypothetical protein
VLRFVRFYSSALLRTIPILGVAANRYVTGVGLVSAALTFFNPEIAGLFPNGLPEISRWWVLVPLLALLPMAF